MPGLIDLSTLGVTKPTTSSAVQPSANVPMVQDLLGDVIPRREGEIMAANRGIAQAQATEIPSFNDRLLSPAGLSALVAAIAGGALGGVPGAIGAASGGLGGIASQVQGDQQALAAKVKQLEDAKKNAQDDLDKTRTRLATLFGQDPAAFTKTDPQTGQMVPVAPPEVIGYYVTGTQLPLDPTAKIMVERRGKQWDSSMKLVGDALAKSQSPEDARVLTRYALKMMDWPDPPDGVVEALATSFGTPKYETELARLFITQCAGSGIQAMIFAAQNNLPLYDYRVLKMLHFYDPNTAGNLSPEQQVTSAYLEALEKINRWTKTHPNENTRINTEAGADNRLYMANLARVALAEDQRLLGAFETKLRTSPTDALDYFRAYGQVAGQFDFAQFLAQMKGLKPTEITSERVTELIRTAVVQQVQDARTEVNRSGATRELMAFDNIVRTRLQPLGLGPAQIDATIAAIRQTALTNATRADGSLDQTLYESEIQRLAQKAQDDLTPKQ